RLEQALAGREPGTSVCPGGRLSFLIQDLVGEAIDAAAEHSDGGSGGGAPDELASVQKRSNGGGFFVHGGHPLGLSGVSHRKGQGPAFHGGDKYGRYRACVGFLASGA